MDKAREEGKEIVVVMNVGFVGAYGDGVQSRDFTLSKMSSMQTYCPVNLIR